MFSNSDLYSNLERIDRRVGRATSVIIQHPVELRVFEGLTPSELSAASAQYDLQIVRRMGGRQLEFTRSAKA